MKSKHARPMSLTRTRGWLLVFAVITAGIYGLAQPLTPTAQAGVLDVNLSTGEEQPAADQPSQTVDLQTEQGVQPVTVTGTNVGFFGLDPRTASAAEWINAVYKFSIAILGFFAVAAITFGAFGYILSAGNEEKIRKSKDVILGAIGAIVLALLSHLILLTIDPRLVQLSSDIGEGETFNLAGTGPTEEVACTSDADCEEVVLRVAHRACGKDATGTVTKTTCDKTAGAESGFCRIPEGGVERALGGGFAGSCNDQSALPPSGIKCASGLVSRPVANNDVPLVGPIIFTELRDVLNVQELTDALFNWGYPQNAGVIDLDILKRDQFIDGTLVENVVRPDQSKFLTDAQTAKIHAPGSQHYLYHKCLPPTDAQKKTSIVRSGTSAGNSCQSDSDCVTLQRPIISCDTTDGSTRRETIDIEQKCEAGVCKIKNGQLCGQQPLDSCGNTSIRGEGGIIGGQTIAEEHCETGS